MIVQGKAGAVEIKDFAGELATLSPQFAQFANGTGLEGIREMGAAFQVIRTGAGSAGQAATQFQALMGEVVQQHKKLGQIGVKVFQKDGKSLRNFTDIMQDLADNKALDKASKVSDIFGTKESQAAVRTIRAQVQEMRNLQTAGRDVGAVQRDLDTVMASPAARIEKAMNNLKLALAEALTPERIEAFVKGLERAAAAAGRIADKFGTFIQDLSGKTAETDNPYLLDENAPTGSEELRSRYARWKKRDLTHRAKFDRMYGVPERFSESAQTLAESNQYDATSRAIKNAGSREEQIKAAIAAKAGNYEGAVPGIYGSGTGGTGRAGQDWMRRLTPSQEEEKRARASLQAQMQQAMPAFAKMVTDAMSNANITVKLDGGAVQQQVNNSPSQRSGRR